MFKKKDRLRVQTTFKRIGYTRRSDYFTLKFFPHQNSKSRFGAAVGKNVARSAVKRNQMKRTILRLLRHSQKQFSHEDVLVIPTSRTGELSKKEFYTALEEIFQKPRKTHG